jgi:hypothetical protein
MPTLTPQSSERQLDLLLDTQACTPTAKACAPARARVHRRDRVSVDLRGLRARLETRAAHQQITTAALVRRAVARLVEPARPTCPKDGTSARCWIAHPLRPDQPPRGGLTDLSLRGIAIELKSVNKRIKSMDDCRLYVEQAASYAAAKAKRVAILCILDCSAKDSAPWSAADGLAILNSAPPAEITVITLVVQGNITRPSKLSR